MLIEEKIISDEILYDGSRLLTRESNGRVWVTHYRKDGSEISWIPFPPLDSLNSNIPELPTSNSETRIPYFDLQTNLD